MVDTRRITQELVEVDLEISGDERITQEFAEIIAVLANTRVTQEWIEVIADSRFGGGIEPVVIVNSNPVGTLAVID